MTTPRVTVPLWMMHVIGPDDLYPAPDHATAVQWSAYVNREIAPRVPEVLCVAVPAIWTGTAEEHADELSESVEGWSHAAPAPEGVGVDDWRPIDSAPIGELVQVYWPCMALDDEGIRNGETLGREGHVSLSIRHSTKHGWEPDNVVEASGDWFGDDFEFGEPTHWKPRPSRPGVALATREEAPAEAKRCCDRTTIGPWCDACKEAPAEAGDDELIERGLRMIRSDDAIRALRDALAATTSRLTGYDWNADPDGVTKQQGEAFSAADRVFADLDAAVAAHPEIELPECRTCGGTGKIEEAAKTEGANQHSACVRTCDDCDGCGFAPGDEPQALATREEAPAEAGERDYPAEFEAWWATYRHRNRDVADYSVKKQIAFDAFYHAALRAQPPAREDVQPVPFMFAYEDVDKPGEWRAFRHQIKRADGSICPGRALFTSPPAPEAEKLRVAVEALESIRMMRSDRKPGSYPKSYKGGFDAASDLSADWASKALAALQQEGRT